MSGQVIAVRQDYPHPGLARRAGKRLQRIEYASLVSDHLDQLPLGRVE